MESSEFNSKSWDELTDVEKIERQRTIIKGLQMNINYALNQITKMTNDFYTHSHNGGQVMTPVNRSSNALGQSLSSAKNLAGSNREDYF